MATTNRVKGREQFFIKGAYEELKKYADNYPALTELEQQVDAMAVRGLRVLAFGSGGWHGEDPASWSFSIVGIIGFSDPPKPSAAEAVLTAQKAGVRVLMITGDYPPTAREIAKSVHIWKDRDGMITRPGY